MSKKNLFITHAVKDKPLANALVELLRHATNIESENIISFSIEEAGLPAGEDLVSHIRNKVGLPATVVMLLTPNYLSSRFCLCEMGAVWALSENYIPLLMPPLKESHLRNIIPAARLIKMDDADDLNRLAPILQEQLGLKDLNLPRWAMEKKKFLDKVREHKN